MSSSPRGRGNYLLNFPQTWLVCTDWYCHSLVRIFLFGLARRLPASCSFVGLDISNDQFPNPDWTPANVTFRVANAMEDPPVDLQGQFDVVHVRLFFCVVENNDPLPMLSHCLKLLKPGGYLQWDEYDPANTGVAAVSSKAPTQALYDMLQAFARQRPLGWIERLDDNFREEGVQSVQLIRARPPYELLKAYSEMLLIAHLEHASLHDCMEAVESGDRVRKVIVDCAEELRHGGACNHMLQIVIGRKPYVGSNAASHSERGSSMKE